jgi:heme exporter protein D
MDFGKFLDMGGYGIWVWPVYGLAAIALVALLLMSLRTLRTRERAFAEMRRHRRGGNDDA